MNIGHIAMLLIIGGSTLWYANDVVGVTTRLTNTIFVVPMAAIVLLAVLWELGAELLVRRREDGAAAGPAAAGSPPQSGRDLLRGVALLVLTAGLVGLYETIGLDVAAFLFVFAALMLLEPSRWMAKAAFAAVFTAIVVGGARWLLPYPLFTALI